jgi:hypothetical protein
MNNRTKKKVFKNTVKMIVKTNLQYDTKEDLVTDIAFNYKIALFLKKKEIVEFIYVPLISFLIDACFFTGMFVFIPETFFKDYVTVILCMEVFIYIGSLLLTYYFVMRKFGLRFQKTRKVEEEI